MAEKSTVVALAAVVAAPAQFGVQTLLPPERGYLRSTPSRRISNKAINSSFYLFSLVSPASF
jgi:hypothetical protein